MRSSLRTWIVVLAVGMFTGLVLGANDDNPNGNPPPPPQGNGGPGGGPGGGQGAGRGGPGAPGGFHLIPRFAAEKLALSDDQKKQIADLEAETKAKLEKILTADQMKTLMEARPPRRGGPGGGQGNQGGPGGGQGGGPGGGQGGPGGPGGGPPSN